ncbi:MAG: VanW family protein [Leptospiraceae bacterium]|nr:VanW family protein [Leptospiraceae bacterium]
MRIFLLLIIIFPFYLFGEEYQQLISSYYISIAKHDANVRYNLELASEKINGKILKQGEIFSFNKVVGEGSVENGFKFASVYFADEVINEPGGGLCIAASGIFNAFLKAGFKIVQRKKHSRLVSYIQPGLDATISYGKTDLKMKNISKNEVLIESKLIGDKIIFKLYSKEKLNFEYEPRTEVTEETYHQISEEKYNSGKLIYVYRDRFQNKEFIESEFLYTDYIRPIYFKNQKR